MIKNINNDMLNIMGKASIRGKVAYTAIKVVMKRAKILNGETQEKLFNFLIGFKPPKHILHERIKLNGVWVEIFQNKKHDKYINDSAIMHLHGGAFVSGLNNLYRRDAIKYTERFNATVFLVDYSLAPKAVFPTALNEAMSVWKWITGKQRGDETKSAKRSVTTSQNIYENLPCYSPNNILICGDSAGGNLALALALKLKEENEKHPAGLVLMSPWTDVSQSLETYTSKYSVDPNFGITLPKPKYPITIAYAGNEALNNPLLSPAFAEYNKPFAPMLFLVGECEMLLDDSRVIHEKAKKNKLDSKLIIYPSMFHCFALSVGLLPEANAAWNEIEKFGCKNMYCVKKDKKSGNVDKGNDGV